MIRHPVTFLFIFPPSLCLRRHDFSIRRAALNVVLLHTLGAQMHFTPAMSLMATLSILSCRCRMQMSAGCLRDGKRVTNDASPSPIDVAFPCAQVRHDTANNLRCTSCGVCSIYMLSLIEICTPQNVGYKCVSVPGYCCNIGGGGGCASVF